MIVSSIVLTKEEKCSLMHSVITKKNPILIVQSANYKSECEGLKDCKPQIAMKFNVLLKYIPETLHLKGKIIHPGGFY